MLDNTELMRICKLLMPKTPFLEIDHPENGFNGYLLRCKAPDIEKGESSLLVKAPGSVWGTYRLPNDLNARIELRKSWWRKTPKNLYVNVNIEPKRSDWDEIDKLFLKKLTDDEIVQISQYLNKIILTHYIPSFEPFAIVWHFKQFKEQPDGSALIRPVHAHFLYQRKTKRISSQESNLIIRK